jgi:hypothetical protein
VTLGTARALHCRKERFALLDVGQKLYLNGLLHVMLLKIPFVLFTAGAVPGLGKSSKIVLTFKGCQADLSLSRRPSCLKPYFLKSSTPFRRR